MLYDDRPGVVERLARAFVSSDLGMEPERVKDADRLAALGMARASKRLGSSILLLDLAGDNSAKCEALAETARIVRKLAAREGWVLDARKAKAIAIEATFQFFAPACPECQGRGFTGMMPGMRGIPKPCPKCRGLGKAPVAGKHAREVRSVLARMEELRDSAAYEVFRRMRDC